MTEEEAKVIARAIGSGVEAALKKLKQRGLDISSNDITNAASDAKSAARRKLRSVIEGGDADAEDDEKDDEN